LIDEEGRKVGVVETSEALKMAREKELDLIEIAPHLTPPIAKILDFGKFKYAQKKQAREKKQKLLEMKEVRLSVNIDEHDLETKHRKIIEFLQKGHKVKMTVVFRGRQMAYREAGDKLLKELIAKLMDSAILEQDLTRQGRMTFVVIAPKRVSRKNPLPN